MAAAFPSQGERRDFGRAARGAEEEFLSRHGHVADEPVVAEQVHVQSGSTGVPLPSGLFESLQADDARQAERSAGRWRALYDRRRAHQAAVASKREERARARDKGVPVAAALRAENMPKEPRIEECVSEEAEVAEHGDGSSQAGVRASGARADMDGRADGGHAHARRAMGRRQRGCH